MVEIHRCPQCGCDTSRDAPAGLCPACLLSEGLATADSSAAAGSVTAARPNQGFVPPQPHELADRFPQFEILELLGFGGMGAVYKARQKSLDRLVALKIIKPEAIGDRGFADRFDREAKALAKLSHSNIVSIHDSGESDGLYYFVMEHVDGTNLRRLIASKELAPAQAIAIIPQICAALQFAHDEGIVHRDIKPENILVDARGRVKIADFGLAKLLGASSLDQNTLTGTHQVMGTPRYMAPEQMEGAKRVDHRADIYSLGVVFYEMLTGELPLGSFEPPSRKAAVDARLDEIVLRSLAKEPERRYQRAGDVQTDVESISHAAAEELARMSGNGPGRAGGQTTSPSAGKGTRGNRLTMALLLILLCGAAGGVGMMFAPWSQVDISPLPGAPRGFLSVGSRYLEVSGYRYHMPIVGAALSLALFVLTLVKAIFAEFPSAARAMLAAATGMVLVLTGAAVLCLAPLPNLPEDYGSLLRKSGHHFTDNDYALRELQILQMQGQVDLRVRMDAPGCFLSMLCGVALLIASVLEFRPVLARQAATAGSDAGSLLQAPAAALRWAAWSSPLAIPVLIVLNVANAGWHSGSAILLMIMLVLQIFHALAFLPLILMGVSRMESLLSPRLARAVCVLSMAPLGLSFVIGLPAGIWALIVLARPEVERAFAEHEVEPRTVERQLRRAGSGLLITGLVSLVFWICLVAASAILLLLQMRRGDDIDLDPVAFWLLALAHPLPIALAAIQVFAAGRALRLESQAWVLVAAVMALVPFSPAWLIGLPLGVWTLAVLLQRGAAEFFAVREKASPRFEPADAAAADRRDTEDQEHRADANKEAEEEKESPRENLEWAAWSVGLVGAFRSWTLVMGGGTLFEKILAGESSLLNHGLLLQLAGPIMVIAAIGMHHARFYWFAVAGAVLCLPTGNCLPVIFGIYALIALFDPKVRALFLAHQALLGADPPEAARAPSPQGSGDQFGSTLGNAWTAWWRERDALFTRVVQSVIMLSHLGCLLAFLGFSARKVTNDQGRHVFTHHIGFPSPWFSFEAVAAANEFSFNHAIHWTTAAWVVAGLGLTLAYIYCRIEKVRNPTKTFWHKPEAFALLWGILALADVGLGAGLAQLAISTNRPTPRLPIDVAAAPNVKTDPTAAGQDPQGQANEKPAPDDPASARQVDHVNPQVAALMTAAEAGSLARVKELLDAGASVNEKDVAGRTLLMKAIESGNRSLALTLVVLGADLTEQDQRGRTALMVAVQTQDRIFLARLRELQTITYQQDVAARKAELRAFSGVERSLLDGRDFDLRNLDVAELERQADENGETASLLAARDGDWELFAHVTSTVDSLRARDLQGRTIAMQAAIHGHAAWFEFLEKSPYFGVAGKSNAFIGQMLMFDLDQLAVTDQDGKTALQLAAEHGQAKIVDILRRHLQAIVDAQAAVIDQGGSDAAQHEALRRQARRALGDAAPAGDDPAEKK